MRNIHLQKAMRIMMRKYDWDYFVTANFNRATNWEGTRRNLKDWHARVDRQLLGGRWAIKTTQRTFFIACSEGGETNLHWHLLAKVADGKQERFEECAAALWEQTVKSGSLDVQVLDTKLDEVRTAYYATKEFWRDEAIEHFVLSTEF